MGIGTAKDGMKRCSTCKVTLSISSFNRNIVTADRLQNVCKKCKAAHTKNWKYALQTGHFDKMLAAQYHRCAICRIQIDELLIDHCHRTGVLRGLLCRKCNTVLGMCDDNIGILEGAIRYLFRWTEE